MIKKFNSIAILFFLFAPLLEPIPTKLGFTIITSNVLMLQTSEVKAKGANFWMNQGDQNFNKGNYLEAITNYTELLKKDKKSKQGYINRGLSKGRIGDNYGGIIDLLKASKLDNKDPFIYEKIGAIYASGLQQFKKAIEYYTISLELEPNPQVYKYRGTVNYYSGNYENAIIDYKKSITMGDSDPYSYYALAEIQYSMNNNQEIDALNNIEKALDLKNDEKKFYYLQGLIYSSLQKPEKTCIAFQKSSDLGYEKFIRERHQRWKWQCERILNPDPWKKSQ